MAETNYTRPQILEDRSYTGRTTALTPKEREAMRLITSPELTSDIYAGITGKENSAQIPRPQRRSDF